MTFMPKAKRSAGAAPELNLRNPDFKTQGRRHQKNKTGVSVALTKRIYVLIFFEKKKDLVCV